MSERGANEVWVERVSPGHCYVRQDKVLAVVQFPHDSEEAEAVRAAFEQLFASRAKGADSLNLQAKSSYEQQNEKEK